MVIADNELRKLGILIKEKSEVAKIGSWELDAEKNRLSWCPMTKRIHEVSDSYIPNIDTAIDFYKEGHSKNTISMAIYKAMQKGTPWREKPTNSNCQGQ